MSQATDAPTAPPRTPESSPAPILDEPHFEIVVGRRVELPPRGASEVLLASILTELMGSFIRANLLGRVVAEMLFRLGPGARRQRRPDVAFVSYARWERGKDIPGGDAWDVVPDLAVEVVSPSNTAAEILDKIDEYFRAGVRRVWVVYPQHRQVYVYDSPLTPRVVGPDGALDGEDLMPGFRLPLAELFEDVADPPPPADDR